MDSDDRTLSSPKGSRYFSASREHRRESHVRLAESRSSRISPYWMVLKQVDEQVFMGLQQGCLIVDWWYCQVRDRAT